MRLGLPQYLLAFVVVVTSVGLVYAGSTSTAAFGGYNPAWDGSQEARTLADAQGDVTVVRDASAYAGLSADATAIVLSPTSEYDDAELAAVRAFIRRGGTLVVAGDFDDGANAILADVGAESQIDGRPLRDERHYGASPAMPMATNVTNSSYSRGVRRLALNYPSVVNASADATVVVRSSSFAYLDKNRNAELDDDETLASRPVVAVEPIGEGAVVVVSDPSLFINTMLAREDNSAFVTRLASEGRVAFDYSHAGGVPPLTALVLSLRESLLAQLGVGALVVAVAAALIEGVRPVLAVRDRVDRRRGSRESRAALSDADVRAFIRERHPEWDRDRIDRLAQSINARSKNDEGER